MNFLKLPFNSEKKILILFVLISIIILANFYFLFQSNKPTELHQPEPDLTAKKVSMIMQMYGCDNPEIFQAIMQTFDPVLIATVIAIESEFRIDAVSPSGARGLMQLTPEKLDDWKNVSKNIQVGASYLKEQLDRLGDLDLAMAAYNAGPTTVARYRGIPPYKETIQYVKKAKLVALTLEKLLSQMEPESVEPEPKA